MQRPRSSHIVGGIPRMASLFQLAVLPLETGISKVTYITVLPNGHRSERVRQRRNCEFYDSCCTSHPVKIRIDMLTRRHRSRTNRTSRTTGKRNQHRPIQTHSAVLVTCIMRPCMGWMPRQRNGDADCVNDRRLPLCVAYVYSFQMKGGE
ncbi:uncharacterized protein [Dermacentor albipictus]|uniref:uncharacterized protein isoform X2 n=1 Tax=Dermacentor albipictus TaxID=60249 RepID=UPI0038FC1C56